MSKQEWKIGDCLDLLPTIEDKSIDMILTDLPYGTTGCKWDTVISFVPLWEHYKRIIKDNGVIVLTASQPFTSALIMSNINMFKYCWVWEKSNSVGFLNSKKMPLKNVEDVCVFYTTLPQYNPQGLIKKIKMYKNDISKQTKNDKGISTHNGGRLVGKYKQEYSNYPKQLIKFNSAHDTIHPTQKPVALFEYLIKTYTNEGDTVHDSCLGSGTTLEACMNTGRNCIGFEISDEWVPHYKKRLMSDNSKLADTWRCYTPTP